MRWEYGLIPLPDWNNTVIPVPDWNKASVHMGQGNMTVNFKIWLFVHFNLDIGSEECLAITFGHIYIYIHFLKILHKTNNKLRGWAQLLGNLADNLTL